MEKVSCVLFGGLIAPVFVGWLVCWILRAQEYMFLLDFADSEGVVLTVLLDLADSERILFHFLFRHFFAMDTRCTFSDGNNDDTNIFYTCDSYRFETVFFAGSSEGVFWCLVSRGQRRYLFSFGFCRLGNSMHV